MATSTSFLLFSRPVSEGPWSAWGDPFKNKDHFHFTNLFLCGLLSKGKQKLLDTWCPQLPCGSARPCGLTCSPACAPT